MTKQSCTRNIFISINKKESKMIEYFFIIFFLIFLRVFVFKRWIMSDKERKHFTVWALIPPTIISAFRDESVGADTEQYINMFQSTQLNNFHERIEKGYIYLNKLLYLITSDSQWLLIIVALFLSICIGVFVYKNAKDPFLAILFFITLGLYQFSLSGIRQTIAIGITILAIELIKKKKLFWFLTIIGLASLFHKTALFFIPAYFIATRDVTLKNLIIYIFSFTIIYLSAEFFLLKVAEILDFNYGIEATNNGQIFFIIVLLITVFSFLNRDSIVQQSNKPIDIDNANIIFINLNFISLLLWTIRLISRTAERVTFYYMPSTYLLLEETIMTIKSKQKRTWLYSIISLLAIVLFFFRLSKDTTITPYSFFFNP